MNAVYLAARYGRREELLVYKAELEAYGYAVTSRWPDGDHQISDEGLALGPEDEAVIEGDSQSERATALRERFAREDIADLDKADICISFTEPPRSTASRGGRHVEFGFAYAGGMRCIVVGPRENVFHCLPEVEVVGDWREAFDLLVERNEVTA